MMTRVCYQQAAAHGKPRILLSAHGLPEKTVRAGDPYPEHCKRTADALMASLGMTDADHVLCYQSRVGPLKWIGPATDDEIRRAGRDKVPIVVVPIAFVSEHSETLVELDIEYRELAKACDVPFYVRAPAIGAAPAFIQGLSNLVRKALQSGEDCISGSGERICASGISRCPYRKKPETGENRDAL